jgi:hypothetical protein
MRQALWEMRQLITPKIYEEQLDPRGCSEEFQ